jgi:hypothetical protein
LSKPRSHAAASGCLPAPISLAERAPELLFARPIELLTAQQSYPKGRKPSGFDARAASKRDIRSRAKSGEAPHADGNCIDPGSAAPFASVATLLASSRCEQYAAKNGVQPSRVRRRSIRIGGRGVIWLTAGSVLPGRKFHQSGSLMPTSPESVHAASRQEHEPPSLLRWRRTLIELLQ